MAGLMLVGDIPRRNARRYPTKTALVHGDTRLTWASLEERANRLANLGEVLAGYRHVVVPEMNLGQLASLLRAEYLVDVESYTKVAGLPFRADELEGVLTGIIKGATAEVSS